MIEMRCSHLVVTLQVRTFSESILEFYVLTPQVRADLIMHPTGWTPRREFTRPLFNFLAFMLSKLARFTEMVRFHVRQVLVHYYMAQNSIRLTFDLCRAPPTLVGVPIFM